MLIKQLDNEKYKGKELIFQYQTTHYFDIEIINDIKGDTFQFVEKSFETVQTRQFTDILLEDWLENPRLYGCVEDDEIVAYVELSHEQWNNRMRISNIWVEESRRGQGIGKELMAVAEKVTREEKARMLILETQSCNYSAIKFYQSCGLSIIGFDLAAYSNDDIEKKELRVEMGKKLD